MSRQLGINTIGEHKFDEIFAGDFPRVSCEVISTDATMDLGKGAILRLTYQGSSRYSGVMATMTELGSPGNNVFAVLGEPLEQGEVGVAYLTGEFIGDRMLISNGSGGLATNWETVRHNLFSRSIFLREAVLPS